MLKVLLKKQLLELNRSFFLNRKTGKAKSRGAAALSIVGFALLMVLVLGGMFFALAMGLLPLADQGLSWLYFALFALVSTFLGIFGSVFNTYASVYAAKDNDTLLSLPIPVGYIIAVRLLGVYLMGLMYSAVVYVPGLVVYFLFAAPDLSGVVGALGLGVLVSLLVLILSCLLGWVVAKISSRLKNKSLITVVLSLAFFAVYYYVYFKAGESLQILLANSAVVGEKLRQSAYPVYLIGRAGAGDLKILCLLALGLALLLVLVYRIMSRSFLTLAAGGRQGKKTVYRAKAAKLRSPDRALLGRELRHFLASPIYMLNCGLGSLLLLIAAVALLLKGPSLVPVLRDLGMDGLLPLILCAAIGFLASMDMYTAPAVSLEGKALWLAQSLPVSPWQVLRSKLRFHMLLSGVPALACSLAALAVIPMEPGLWVGLLLLPQALLLFTGSAGLALNLKNPDLNWTSETAPIKQGTPVLLTMLCSVGCLLVLAGLYALLGRLLSGPLFILMALALVLVLCALLLRWLKTRGARIFAAL